MTMPSEGEHRFLTYMWITPFVPMMSRVMIVASFSTNTWSSSFLSKITYFSLMFKVLALLSITPEQMTLGYESA